MQFSISIVFPKATSFPNKRRNFFLPSCKNFESNYMYLLSRREAVHIQTMEGSSCLKMGIPLLFFFFLFMRLFGVINGDRSQYDECKASRCSHHGPPVRFPFWLKDQAVPDHCGYLGFELSCSEEKRRTILQLPNSVKLLVKKINYTSQEMVVRHLDDCVQRQIVNRNISATPFHFTNSIDYFSFFSCLDDKSKSYGFWSRSPSTCSPSDTVYVFPSAYDLTEVNLTSCRKIFNATLPKYILDGEYEFSMNWSNPNCRNCEAQGKQCQRKKKSNSTEPEIECIHKPAKGT